MLLLVGLCHHLTLDFGRETNTWMEPRWAAETRAEFAAKATWRCGGIVEIEDVRPTRGLALGQGTVWKVEPECKYAVDKAGTLRVRLDHQGFSVGDCDMPQGFVDLAIPIFGNSVVSSKEGIMSIIAYRFGIRKERRIVGTWRASLE